MPAHQALANCIQLCQQTAQQLRTLAARSVDPVVRDKLNEGAHHLDLCVSECRFAMDRTAAMAGVMG